MKAITLMAALAALAGGVSAEDAKWEPLFNGKDVIKHFINGEEVITYRKAQYGGDAHAEELAKLAGTQMISEGYICLQSESHPVAFRKLEIQILK